MTMYVSGASVLGMRYEGGVIVGADTLLSYGSLARYRNYERIKNIGKETIIGGTGEIGDFQYVTKILEAKVTEDICVDDGTRLSPKSLYNLLCRIMYSRRSKFDPLLNSLVVAGWSEKTTSIGKLEHGDGDSFLGYADMHGTSFQDDYVATGYGSYLAIGMMRNEWKSTISKDDARDLLLRCLRVLLARDARSSGMVQFATVDSTGYKLEEPVEVKCEWGFAQLDEEQPQQQQPIPMNV